MQTQGYPTLSACLISPYPEAARKDCWLEEGIEIKHEPRSSSSRPLSEAHQWILFPFRVLSTRSVIRSIFLSTRGYSQP